MVIDKIKKIALIGATKNKEKFGNIILKDLVKKGYIVFPVNPNYEEIEGIKTYRSVQELPKDVELLVFVVPPQIGLEEMKKAYKFGFRKFWFQPGAESDDIITYSKTLKDAEFSFSKCIMVETK
ncbi:MAG: CoA-binding protein [Fervidobacterium sp.]|nr:CoA-binding protein [Fervidobacterium sp.]